MAGVELEVAKNKVKISKMSKIYQKVRLGKRRKVDSSENDMHTKEEKSKSPEKIQKTEEEGNEQQTKQLEEGEIL